MAAWLTVLAHHDYGAVFMIIRQQADDYLRAFLGSLMPERFSFYLWIQLTSPLIVWLPARRGEKCKVLEPYWCAGLRSVIDWRMVTLRCDVAGVDPVDLWKPPADDVVLMSC